MNKPFSNLEEDPRTTIQQELAELTDWQRRLDVADYEFNSEQRAVIEKLMSPKDRDEIKRLFHEAWYAAARGAIATAIAHRRETLGIDESTKENGDLQNEDEILFGNLTDFRADDDFRADGARAKL